MHLVFSESNVLCKLLSQASHHDAQWSLPLHGRIIILLITASQTITSWPSTCIHPCQPEFGDVDLKSVLLCRSSIDAPIPRSRNETSSQTLDVCTLDDPLQGSIKSQSSAPPQGCGMQGSVPPHATGQHSHGLLETIQAQRFFQIEPYDGKSLLHQDPTHRKSYQTSQGRISKPMGK